MSSGCLCYSMLRKARKLCSKVRGENPGITQASSSKGFRSKVNVVAKQFFCSSYQPLVTNIQTNDQPEPGHACIGEQKPRDRRLRNLYCGLWPNAFYSATHDLFISS